ncbi:MAG: AraC family transcriptional regulator [Shimia sp.]
MRKRTYTLDGYLRPDEHYHFARKQLGPARPRHAHDHDYFELFLVEKGTIAHTINGREEELTPGTLTFIRPTDTHALSAVGESAQIINVMFAPSVADHLGTRYADDLSGAFFWQSGPLPASHRLEGPRIERAINQSLELQSARRTLSRIESYLLTLMTHTVEVFDHATHHLPPWLRHACEQARLPAVFRQGAAGFVRAAGRGHEHVARQTKAHLGVTPSAYVNRMRMEYAALKLASEDLPIPGVAEACGIENLSHFYRLFRHHYGVTPRAYRLLHQKDPV